MSLLLLFNSGSAAVADPVAPLQGSNLLAFMGDDFKVRSGTQRTITVSDTDGDMHTRLAAIGVANLQFGASRPQQSAGEVTGTISSLSYASNVLSIVIEITDCAASLAPGLYDYQIQSSQLISAGVYDDAIEIYGTMEVFRRTVATRD